MSRAVRLLAGAGLLIAGILLVLYGLFAILYAGDSGGSGDTYVEVAGHEVDADLVGAIALLVAFFLVLFAFPLLSRKGRVNSS
jgi:hypothetical protein